MSAIPAKQPWDTECDATKVALERLMRGLLQTRSHFTDSFALADISKPTRGVTVFLRVWVPEGQEECLSRVAKIVLTKPPRVSL